MTISPARLEGIFTVDPEPHQDARGFFARTYCDREFSAAVLNTTWVQQNHTRTNGAGSVRGMHYQAVPNPETKLVRCVVGRVWDVVVDVRPHSATYGQWEDFELSSDNMRALYIPAGFAHGFQCLEECCELFYLMSDYYQPALARGVRCDDPELGIEWPLTPANLSERDLTLPSFRDLE